MIKSPTFYAWDKLLHQPTENPYIPNRSRPKKRRKRFSLPSESWQSNCLQAETSSHSTSWYAMARISIAVLFLLIAASSGFEFKHHDNQELLQVLQDVNMRCPNISRIYTLSETSVLDVPLYVIEFSTKPGHHQICKYIFIIIFYRHHSYWSR